MFGKFKERIKNWTKKIAKKDEIKEAPQSEKIEEASKLNKKDIFTPQKKYRGSEKLKQKSKEEDENLKPGEKGFFKKITSKITKIKISEKEFEIYEDELETLLLENNVALEVAEKIIQKLKSKIIGEEFLKKEAEEEIKEIFKEIIKEILIEPFDILEKIKEKSQDQAKEPYVILFCGVNGTGKTTTIAKIAKFLQKNDLSTVLAAADTFRAASIEQITIHAKKLGIKVISHEYGSDPAAVGFDAIKYAKKNFIDCVLIDTAGRMYNEKNLLKELEKISRVCKPDLKLFIGESITGNDSIEQAKSFDWQIGIDGAVLTKADVDERGGTALSLGYILKKPILYLGTGQEYNDIKVFNKEKFIQDIGL